MKWFLRILEVWALVMCASLYFAFNVEDATEVSPYIVNIMQQNRVALTCGDAGGQGTITQVDNDGLWIRTARHVVGDQQECTALFRDYSVHTAYISKLYSISDEAVLFVSRGYWPTHASMASLKLGETVATFGEIHLNTKSSIFAFGWDFDDTVHTGKTILPVNKQVMEMSHYPAPAGNLIFTSLYSAPGSSGEAVYDLQGNMVGIISGGSAINHNQTIIVNLEASMEAEQ